MKIIAFTKMLKYADADALIRIAHTTGIEGYDLCVRDGYFVNPENVASALPTLVKQLSREGVPIPMVTGEGIWSSARDSLSQRLFEAMGDAGVGLYKTGYYFYRPDRDGPYAAHADRFRRDLAEWIELGRKHGVKVCYHTHCDVPGLAQGYFIGTSCGELLYLLRDFDPQTVGAYIGTGNLIASGEPFEQGLAILEPYIAIVELQDMGLNRVQSGDEGMHRRDWSAAGEGAVTWSQVFNALTRIAFNGPATMHLEYEVPETTSFESLLEREVAYFRMKRQQAQPEKRER